MHSVALPMVAYVQIVAYPPPLGTSSPHCTLFGKKQDKKLLKFLEPLLIAKIRGF